MRRCEVDNVLYSSTVPCMSIVYIVEYEDGGVRTRSNTATDVSERYK